MSYVISSKLLPTDYREEMITKTLDLYRDGDLLDNSPLIEWGRRVVARGDWWYGCEGKDGQDLEGCLLRRQKQVIELYHSLSDRGYTGSPISIFFEKDTGQVQTYDGFHRLSIMKYLGIEADMNCVVSHHHPDPNQRGDFPLAEALAKIHSGHNLYQPVEDPRVEGWTLWRPDSYARLALVKELLVPGTVVDVGCDTGFFSRGLAREGYQVTSLDHSPQRLAVARYLATISNLEINYILGPWHHELNGPHFDNVVMLSLLHHDFLARGVDPTFKNLEILRGRCKRIIIELPIRSKQVSWLPEDKKDAWDFKLEELVMRLEAALDLLCIQAMPGTHPARPFMVLGEKT